MRKFLDFLREKILPFRKRIEFSLTDDDGRVRIAISAADFGFGHWLDTGGRHRGFVVVRWLDNPKPPGVTVSVRRCEERA